MERFLYLALFMVFLALAALFFGAGLLIDHGVNTNNMSGISAYLFLGNGVAQAKSIEMFMFVFGAFSLFIALFVYILFMSAHRPKIPNMYNDFENEE